MSNEERILELEAKLKEAEECYQILVAEYQQLLKEVV